MSLKHVPSNASAEKNVVFKDTSLTLSMAIVQRKLVDGRFVFSANSMQEFLRLLQFLLYLKAGEALSADALNSPIFTYLHKNGYVTEEGKMTPLLKNGLDQNYDVEFFFKTRAGHYASFFMGENGLAYLDPTGAPCPNDAIPIQSDQKIPFQEFVKNSWVQFYNVKNKRQVEESTHFHKDIKLQTKDKDHENLDWCLTAFNAFESDIAANEVTLKNQQIIDRKKLVTKINGQPNPDKLGENFALTYKDISFNKEQVQAWRRQVDRIEERHKTIYERANSLWEQADQSGNAESFLSKPPWLEVVMKTPPGYFSVEKLNEFTSPHPSGMKTHFKLESNNNIKATSTGGQVTYKTRFLQLATELRIAMFEKEDVPIFITISRINPSSQQAVCTTAFEKIFGENRVVFTNEDEQSSEETEKKSSTGMPSP